MVAVKGLSFVAHRVFGAVYAVCLNYRAAHEKAALLGVGERLFCHDFSLLDK